jgi:hypothetical protein
MRFLNSLLAKNTTLQEPTKPTKPIFEPSHTTGKEPSKPTKPSSVGFVGAGTLVSQALGIFGARVLSPEESRELVAEDSDWAAIQAERDHWT